MIDKNVAGLVIAGGASSRFGGEKAVAAFHGRPLLAWSLGALDPLCAAVAVSARPGCGVWQLAIELDRTTLADDHRHPQGPLAGVAAGMKWAAAEGHEFLVTAPVDTPLFGGGESRRLLEAIGAAPAAYATTDSGAQGLCAVWRVDLFETLRARLNSGDHPSVWGWLGEMDATPVVFNDPSPFRNVNTRADLATLEAGLAARPRRDA